MNSDFPGSQLQSPGESQGWPGHTNGEGHYSRVFHLKCRGDMIKIEMTLESTKTLTKPIEIPVATPSSNCGKLRPIQTRGPFL